MLAQRHAGERDRHREADAAVSPAMDWHAAMPFGGLLGIELVGEPSPEEVRARLAWREELCTAGGLLHGGALMGARRQRRRSVRVPQPARRGGGDGDDPVGDELPAARARRLRRGDQPPAQRRPQRHRRRHRGRSTRTAAPSRASCSRRPSCADVRHGAVPSPGLGTMARSARGARRSWPCPGRRRRTSSRGRPSCPASRGR